MKIIKDKIILKELIRNEKNLGFVPTMGAIHKGHLSLIKRSKLECDKTIVSIFINKPQFNNKRDFNRYPKIIDRDIKTLKKVKIDYLFLPKDKQIYFDGKNKNIKISPLEKKLCGKFRPGHFKAVVDVIDRFIKIVKPKKIYLGEKDMQQLKIIDHFVKRNHKKTRVIGCKTIREKNGVACSSRNFLLSREQKSVASKIYKLLHFKRRILIKNKSYLKKIKKKIKNLGIKRIEYLKVIDINKLTKPYIKSNKYKIFIAYYLGKVRLIDNI